MPTFEITSPDGRKFRVTGPEGATQEDALRQVQSQYSSPKPEAEDPGALMAGVIGAGRALDRLKEGVKQGYYGLTGDTQALAEQKQREDENTRIYAGLQEKRPLATTIGEIAPLVAAVPAVGGIVGATALGAIPGAIEYGTSQEKLGRAALGAAGGAAGTGIGKLLGRVVQPVRADMTPARQAGIEAAQRLGVELSPGQLTGNYGLQQLESRLAKAPIASGAMQMEAAKQTEAINRAAARAIGQDAPALTDAVLDAAKTQLGATFNDIASRNTIRVGGDELLGALSKIDTKARELGDFAPAGLSTLVDKGLELAARGQVSGQVYQTIRSELGKQAQSAFNAKNTTLGEALKTLQTSLDDAANKSISAADREAWDLARKQYQALKIINTRTGAVEAGNVRPAIVANKVDKATNVRSQEVRDIAKLGETFKALPDSGTAQNALWQTLIAGGLGMISPVALAAGITGPAALQKLMFSPAGKKYLTRGLLNISPEAERKLMQGGYGLLGLPSSAVVD